MTIEETCACGAKLILRSETYSLSQAMREVEDRALWQQVNRWRDMHRACLVRAAKIT